MVVGSGWKMIDMPQQIIRRRPRGRPADALPDKTDIVIIGAGPVGLTASLLLDQWQIAHIVVEAQDPPSNHPQAHFISARSMEIYRELELEEKIRTAAAIDQFRTEIQGTGVEIVSITAALNPAGDMPLPSFQSQTAAL